MKQTDFNQQHQARWHAIERWLTRRELGEKALLNLPPISATGFVELTDLEFPAAFRQLCQHLSIAQSRAYSQMLVDYLQRLVQRGHAVLYQAPRPKWHRALHFIALEFPALVRAHSKAMWVSAALFFIPFLGMIYAIQERPDLAFAVVEPEQLYEYQTMYGPDKKEMGRDGGSDLEMFGFYIFNNIGIGLRTFASGLVFCIGAVFVVLSNGVIIGTVAGHITQVGYGYNFWRFVVGHSGPELLAIVISGGAGLMLGMALLAPGQKTRVRALLDAGVDGAKLAMGIFLMLLLAAFIEAFWSSKSMFPDWLKYGSGIGMWLMILGWLFFAGRGLERDPEYGSKVLGPKYDGPNTPGSNSLGTKLEDAKPHAA